MHFYIYKITNNLNGCFYIGRRQCECNPEEDTYFGSGKVLFAAIKKYGKENFSKEILCLCDSHESLVAAEIDIVTEELIKNDMCYNLALGGHGGYTYYEERVYKHDETAKRKISESKLGVPRTDMIGNAFGKKLKGMKRSEEDKKKKSEAAFRRLENGCNPFGHMIQCSYCMKTGQLPNMKRWHFDKCKHRVK